MACSPSIYGTLLQWLLYRAGQCFLCRFGEDAYAWYKRGSHEGWRPDADMYEQLLSWMCTQENLVDEAETIIRKEMPVRHPSPLYHWLCSYRRQSGVSWWHQPDHCKFEHDICGPPVCDQPASLVALTSGKCARLMCIC